MPYIELDVGFDAAAYEALVADPSARLRAQRPGLFSIEPLHALGVFPCADDLVSDVRLIERVWRVHQRSMLVDDAGDATMALLVTQAPDAKLSCVNSVERVQLSSAARGALIAQYVGREYPDESLLLFNALRARPDLKAGDAVQDTRIAPHTAFVILERLFVWSLDGDVEVRYLLDLGMRPSEWKGLED